MKSADLLCALLAGATAAQGLTAPTVQLQNGTIAGVQCTNASVTSYLALPYAQAPIGNLRFAAPRANTTWLSSDTVFNATQQSPSCPQFDPSSAEKGAESEDCLNLNVYAPLNATANSSLPVKVWIYGGSNEDGGIADPTYNGCFAAQDSIMVSVNYRLGPLGWLSLQSANISGNYGFQDQLLALQWVQENIAAFGGDPKRVLLFGQSAGAVDVFNLAASPQGAALISSAIMESGGGRDLPTIQQANTHNTALVSNLNCTTDVTACLRTATVEQLKDANIAMNNLRPPVPGADTLFPNSGFGSDWGPVIDGEIITQQPSKQGTKVPSIFGSNSNDGSLFVLSQYGFASPNRTQYNDFLTYNFGPFASNVSAKYPFPQNASESFIAMSNIITSYAYKCPAYRGLSTASANSIPVWTYQFSHEPSCDWYTLIPNLPQILQILGATHTAEIPFVLGLTENLPPPNGTCESTPAEKGISRFMLDAWTNMAAQGSPGDGTTWPKWKRGGDVGIVVRDEVELEVVDYSECGFWDEIAKGILQGEGSNASQSTGGGTATASTTSSSAAVTVTSSTAVSTSVASRLGRDVVSWVAVLGLAVLIWVL